MEPREEKVKLPNDMSGIMTEVTEQQPDNDPIKGDTADEEQDADHSGTSNDPPI